MCRRVSKSQSSYRRQPHLIVSIRNQIVARLRLFACACVRMHVFMAAHVIVHVCTSLYSPAYANVHCWACPCPCSLVFIRVRMCVLTCAHMRMFIATRVFSHIHGSLFACACIHWRASLCTNVRADPRAGVCSHESISSELNLILALNLIHSFVPSGDAGDSNAFESIQIRSNPFESVRICSNAL